MRERCGAECERDECRDSQHHRHASKTVLCRLLGAALALDPLLYFWGSSNCVDATSSSTIARGRDPFAGSVVRGSATRCRSLPLSFSVFGAILPDFRGVPLNGFPLCHPAQSDAARGAVCSVRRSAHGNARRPARAFNAMQSGLKGFFQRHRRRTRAAASRWRLPFPRVKSKWCATASNAREA